MEPGALLGHYTVLSEIGRGGMGVVWKAKDNKLGREVAIKTLPAEFAQDPDRLARFEREARLLASLNHPNIAAIHGFEESQGTHFLVLELVEGDTLADRLARGAIPVEQSLKFALQIAEALESAHENGVVHRDLKPANIKVTGEGRVKVLDFGLAKAFAGDGSGINPANSPTLSLQATEQGVILGTAAYMSPEQAGGEPTDARADVWAFGVVLFEMLTGGQLFTGKNVTHILADVVRAEPEWDRLPPNLHPRIRLLLEGCLEKEARDRLSSISDARVQIQKVLADPEGFQVQPAAPSGAPVSGSRKPVLAAALGGVVLAAITGVAVWLLQPSQPLQVTRFPFLLPDGQIISGSRFVDVSRDGTHIVYAAGDGLHLRALDEMSSIPIQGAQGRLSNPRFSPDGQRIVYLDRDTDELLSIPRAGGAPTRVPVLEDDSWDLDWTADGSIVFVTAEGIQKVSSSGGTPSLIVALEEGEQIDSPQMLPGGESVLFVSSQGGEPRIVVGSRNGDRTDLGIAGIAPRYIPATGHILYVLDDGLWAVPFDVDTFTTVGDGPALMEQRVGSDGLQANYSVSDSGTLAYVVGGSGGVEARTLVMVDRNGNSEVLTDEFRAYQRPRVSPQGDRIAVEVTAPGGEGATHIYIVQVDTGVGTPLTINGNQNLSAVWSNDGETVVFASDQGPNGRLALYRRRADGTGQAELVLEAESDLVPTDMLPGDVVLFQVTGVSDLRTVNLADGTETDFIVTDAAEFEAHASPDGTWVAFASDRSGGQPGLWVVPYPPTGDSPRSVTDTPGLAPLWSVDGNQIYFFGYVGGASFFAASVETTPTFRRGTQTALFSLASLYIQEFATLPPYDVTMTPDGERFVFVQPAETGDASSPAQPRINIIVNWFEELRERAPRD